MDPLRNQGILFCLYKIIPFKENTPNKVGISSLNGYK